MVGHSEYCTTSDRYSQTPDHNQSSQKPYRTSYKNHLGLRGLLRPYPYGQGQKGRCFNLVLTHSGFFEAIRFR